MVLITIDTLRADHLGAYGGDRVVTPNNDRLSAEGILFERAFTPMPRTRPAHASIFTSRYPREHGVVNNALSLPEDFETLAEQFRDQGYRTGASVGVVGSDWKYTRTGDRAELFAEDPGETPVALDEASDVVGEFGGGLDALLEAHPSWTPKP